MIVCTNQTIRLHLLIRFRVAGAERTNSTRRHIPSFVHRRRRRKRPTRYFTISPLRLWQHASSHNTTNLRLLIRPQPKAISTRRTWQEIWQEDGQCRYLRRWSHDRQQHRERHFLNGLTTILFCYKKLDAVRLRLLLQIPFGYGLGCCGAETGVKWV